MSKKEKLLLCNIDADIVFKLYKNSNQILLK